MNSLSLLIYAVGLITDLGNWAVAGIIFFAVVSVLNIIAWAIRRFPDYNKPGAEEIAVISKVHGKWRNRFIAGFVVCMLINIFVPSRQTTIMIAASEVAEVVIKSEEAQNVMKDVTGLGSDAVSLLKSYIQVEQTKLMDEIKAMTKEPKKAEAAPDKA